MLEWHIMRTYSRQEAVVERNLIVNQIENYLPRRREIRFWKDRKKVLDVPVFPGYLFVKIEPSQVMRLHSTPGSCGLLMWGGKLGVIRETEISNMKRLLKSGIELEAHKQLIPGTRVLVRSGPLSGLEGELATFKNKERLVINAYLLGQAVSVEINVENIEKA